MADPVVTVVCLCYNTGRYAVKALDCVRRQTYQAIQLVIVDDASTDGSAALLRAWMERTGYPCTLVQNGQNVGIPGVLNRALGLANGEYVTWISDDLWDDDRLATVTSVFQDLPAEVGVVFGDAIVIDADDQRTGATSPCRTLQLLGHPLAGTVCGSGEGPVILEGRAVWEALFWRCFLAAPSATVRRRVYEDVGGYDETLAIEDLDFWLRASRRYDFAYVRRPLVRYRVHATNFTAGIRDAYLDSLAETLRRHAKDLTLPATRSALRRHLREEAYRVIQRLTAAGLHRRAARVFRRHYLPNLQLTLNAVKETVRVCAALLHPGIVRESGP